MGLLPAMGRLTRAQASIFLLLGYESEWNSSGQDEFPEISYLPFYNSDLSIYNGSFYAGLLYEKLERSQSQCWILNAKSLGPRRDDIVRTDLQLMRQFVSATKSDGTEHIEWHKDKIWKFDSVCSFGGYSNSVLNPEKAWKDHEDRFLVSMQRLRDSFSKRLSGYENELTEPLKEALELFVK